MIALLILVGVSFGSALVVGYAVAGAEVAAEKAKESPIGQRIGRWLFLMPIWDGIDNIGRKVLSFVGASADEIRSIGDADIPQRLFESVLTVLRTVFFALLFVGGLWVVFWLVSLVATGYMWKLALAVAVAWGLYYLVGIRS